VRQSKRSSTLQHDSATNLDDSNDRHDPGDDFDDFEEGAQAGADDDFGDFDEEFQEPESEAEAVEASPVSTSQSSSIPAEPFVSFCPPHFSLRILR